MKEKPIVIALAGNPNSGKTSVFNFITGSRQHVGNYPGVTVEKKEGTIPVDDVMVTFTDLPGTYSLTPFSPDESVARSEILSERISAVIIVVDTSRLERNLYLASQIIETGKPVVVALNMYDEFEASGNVLDIDQLSAILGVPIVKTVGNRGRGITELMSTTIKVVRGELPAVGHPPRYNHEMEHAIEKARGLIHGKTTLDERWATVNLLLFGPSFLPSIEHDSTITDLKIEADRIRQKLEEIEGDTIQTVVTEGRYGYAAGAVAECLTRKPDADKSVSEKIDTILTHRWFGFPIFLFMLWIMFQSTFTFGELPMKWIEVFFVWLGNSAAGILPDGLFESLIVDGIISGVGGVLVFLPNILILFCFISLFEDTGYMARAAFIMDRVMHSFGLHGKSFLPMLVGFGCSVPAIMATRIIENKRDRLITIFIIPFMSCSARLPVYILLAGAFFSPGSAGNVIFSLYLVGIALSLIVARLLTVFQGKTLPFVMELPPYRIPTFRSVVLHIWERAYMYFRKAGTIILTFSIIIWILMTFPRSETSAGFNSAHAGKKTDLSQTYAGKFGKFIEPVLKPLGFDWRIGVALTAGFAAKEVVVSTFATIYSIGGDGEEKTQNNLKQALRNDPTMNPVKAYGLMLFILIYVPCIAVLGVLKREAGGFKWVVIMILYTITLAWLVSFSFITIASLFLQ